MFAEELMKLCESPNNRVRRVLRTDSGSLLLTAPNRRKHQFWFARSVEKLSGIRNAILKTTTPDLRLKMARGAVRCMDTIHNSNRKNHMDFKEGQYKVRDLTLADAGGRQLERAESRMPVLMALREKYSKTKPL